MKFVALLFIFALVFAEVEMEDGVIVLNDDNFDEILSQHESLLVKFYAPVSSCSFILTDQWCGHCKKLAPEYAAAAKELATLDPPLYLAQVDATACPKLSQRFAIRGYPTLKFFKNGNAVDYDSGRSKQDIVNYMKKKSGPVAVAYNNKDDLETAIEAVDVAIVGFFENTESEEYKKWYAVMATLDDATAIYVTDADLAKEMGVEVPSIYLFKTLASKLRFEGKDEDLKKWIILNELPLIVPFSQQYSRKLFSPEHGIKAQLMYFAPEKDLGEPAKALEKVAAQFQGKMFIVHIPSENARLLDYFGITAEDVPALAMADFAGEGMDKYLFEGEITEENVADFANKFFEGKLTAYFKSEDIPEEQVGPVYKVVGKSFDEIVYNPKKNVFVKFYAPWCGHCKALAPIYEELAQAYADDKDVIIAEMDATANEVADINIRGFPTLKFFKAGGDGKSVVDYEGDRTLEAFKEFIEKNRIVVEQTEEEL